MGAEVLVGSVDAINDTVRNDCRWPTAMVSRLIKAFNESDDPPPRAKLESRPIDIEKYPGRRLVLRLNEVHALGGGRLDRAQMNGHVRRVARRQDAGREFRLLGFIRK